MGRLGGEEDMGEQIRGRDVEELVEELHQEMMTELKTDVKNRFLKVANEQFKPMGLDEFFSADVLESIFEGSVFMELFESDPGYLFEFSSEYWGDHILSEINNSFDLEKLKQLEEADALRKEQGDET